MPPDAAARYANLTDTAYSQSVHIVSLADIRQTQPNDTVFFQLPGRLDTLWAEATMVTDNPSDGFIWSGRLLNHPGYLAFLIRNGLTAGFLQEAGDFYELTPLDSTYQFWTRRKHTALAGCGTPEDTTTYTEPPGPDYCSLPLGVDTFNTCPALISVLLVLTNEGKKWILEHFGNIDTYVALGQITVNMAFGNSAIPNKEVRVKWIEQLGLQAARC